MRFIITTLKYVGSVLLLLNPSVFAQPKIQSPQDSPNATTVVADANAGIAKWSGVLDQLAIDARTLSDENVRSAALNSVADAYWELSQRRSKELFVDSLNLALSIEIEKDRQAAVNRVIYAASRRDSRLTETLTQILLETKNSSHQAIQASLDLLKSDIRAAEAIALASSSFGASFDSAWLLFQLHQQDPQAADRVYVALLNNQNSRRLNKLLWLSGYPFGYGEAFGGATDPIRFAGISGFDFGSLKANRALALAFLRIADESVASTLNQVSSARPEEVEGLISLVFFTVTYLLPEVEKYRPDLYPRWTALQTNASGRINPNHREKILSKLSNILAERERVRNRTTDEQEFSDEVLENAEKLASSCQRDAIFARAALKLTYKKDFKKAMLVADKINSLELRGSIIQFIFYDMSVAAMTTDSSTKVDQALEYASRVTAPEQRALLFLKLSAFTQKSGDQQYEKQLLIDASRLAERVADHSVQAGLMLALADQFSEANFEVRFKMLKGAVAAVNRKKEINIDKISVERRVNFGCEESRPQWYGESLAQFNLIDSILRFSQAHEDQAVQVALDLDPGVNRVRTLAAIAGSSVKNLVAKREPVQKTRRSN